MNTNAIRKQLRERIKRLADRYELESAPIQIAVDPHELLALVDECPECEHLRPRLEATHALLHPYQLSELLSYERQAKPADVPSGKTDLDD